MFYNKLNTEAHLSLRKLLLLLQSQSILYIKPAHISLSGKRYPEDHYLKDKLELTAIDFLSNIFMHLDTVNRAIYNISEDMEVVIFQVSNMKHFAQIIRLSMI